MAVWPAHLLPQFCHQDARPRQLAAIHTPTAPLTAEQLYAVAAALLADGGESFIHHYGRALITGSIPGPQHNGSHPWRATLREPTGIRDTNACTPFPGPQQGEALVMQAAGYQVVLHGQAGG